MLIAYPHYARKKKPNKKTAACSKGQSTEHIKDTGFSPSLPLLTGNQGRGVEADGVGVAEVKPKYLSCDELLISQTYPRYWEKSQQTSREQKQEVA